MEITISKENIPSIILAIFFLTFFFYIIIFLMPKMNKEQIFQTGVYILIAVIIIAVISGALKTFLEDRKQKKLTQWAAWQSQKRTS